MDYNFKIKLFIFSATLLLYLLCVSSVHSSRPKKHSSITNQENRQAQQRRSAKGQVNSNSNYHNHQQPQIQENNKDTLQLPTQNVRIIIPDLPPHHYQFWLKNHPRAFKVFEEICSRVPKPIWSLRDVNFIDQLHLNLTFENSDYWTDLNHAKILLDSICSKIGQIRKSCWGYENNCQDIYLMPECSGSSDRVQDQKIAWFTQADFGYVLERRKEMNKYCAPSKADKHTELSSLECTKHFTSCRGNNLFIQFNPPPPSPPQSDNNTQPDRQTISDQLISISKIGAYRYCDLQKARIREEAGRAGRLESWFGELGNYERIDSNEKCDIRMEEQVFFVKIDSSDNFHDYLGTFINLYATIHLNNRFSDDNQIVIWDEQSPRNSLPEAMWAAFSRFPPVNVGAWVGKKVCLDKFIFAMPPKMTDGLFNREFFTEGCSKSGLFNAFHEHIIHRLKIPNFYYEESHVQTKNNMVRVLIIDRSNSEIGRILNIDKLEQRIRNEPGHFVANIAHNSVHLNDMLNRVLNSDIIVGLHNSGLSYALFAPAWGALIELNSNGKPRYQNLARLRGISYFTQDNDQDNMVNELRVGPESKHYARLNSSDLLDHSEHSDYTVDIEQFMKVFLKARDLVLSNRENYFTKSGKQVKDEPVQTEAKQEHVTEKSTSTTPSTTTTSTTTPKPTTTSTTTSTTTTTGAPSQARVLKDGQEVEIKQEADSPARHTEL